MLVGNVPLTPNPNLAVTKIPDATPGIIGKYTFSDEQAVLARVRYNRLIDIFLGITCYSLQNHFRTTVPGMGQVETDEMYVGVDRSGAHYVIPVQAKSENDRLSRVQIEQDVALCASKLPSLICRPVGVHMMRTDLRRHQGCLGKALPACTAGRRHRRRLGEVPAADFRQGMMVRIVKLRLHR